jgi:hypothetical protein
MGAISLGGRALDKQIGGDHYKKMKIQTTEFCMANNLDHCQSNVVKYVCRHADKNGEDDLRKAIHYLEMLIEFKYPVNTTKSVEELNQIHRAWKEYEEAKNDGPEDEET